MNTRTRGVLHEAIQHQAWGGQRHGRQRAQTCTCRLCKQLQTERELITSSINANTPDQVAPASWVQRWQRGRKAQRDGTAAT